MAKPPLPNGFVVEIHIYAVARCEPGSQSGRVQRRGSQVNARSIKGRQMPTRSHDITTVIKKGFCIGCGACAVIDSRFQVQETSSGANQVLHYPNEDALISKASRVCPFSDALDEDTIAEQLFPTADYRDADLRTRSRVLQSSHLTGLDPSPFRNMVGVKRWTFEHWEAERFGPKLTNSPGPRRPGPTILQESISACQTAL